MRNNDNRPYKNKVKTDEEQSSKQILTDGGVDHVDHTPTSSGGGMSEAGGTSDSGTTGKQAFYDRLTAELEPDVGPVEGEECEARCDEDAVYRVPWPHIGGDVAYCGYHLACYKHDQPEIWDRVRSGPYPDPQKYVEVGNRFISLDEIPEKIRSETFRRICLDHEGYALFESSEPDDEGYVTYIRVDKTLGAFERNRVRKEISGELLGWYQQEIGWRHLDPEVQEALFG